ncbi:MAG: hypothetical protein K2H28_00390 [Ruminococcus sp.]|nr:hypothetical protein [Ruminococcus sp.]
MKKLLQTAGCCFFSFVIMLIAQAISNIISNLIILVGFPAFMGIVVFAVLYPLFTYLGVKYIIAKIYNLDLQEIGIKKFSVRPVWCITALILPVAIMSAFVLMTGSQDLFPYENITPLISTLSLVYIAVVIPQEMALCCVITGIIRKNYNTKSAVIIFSVIYSIINIAISNNLSPNAVIPVFITGMMSGMMFALVLLESGNFWNSVLINISVAILTIFTAVSGIGINGDNAIKLSVISAIGYITVDIIAFIMIKKKANQNPEKTEINEN